MKTLISIPLLISRNARTEFRRHPGFRDAVVAAARSGGRGIKLLKNFGEGWDLPRFAELVVNFPKENQFPQRIQQELVRWREDRNSNSHPSHSGEGRKEIWRVKDLVVQVDVARVYLPEINSLKKGSVELKRVWEKLDELKGCLEGEDV